MNVLSDWNVTNFNKTFDEDSQKIVSSFRLIKEDNENLSNAVFSNFISNIY